MEFEKYDSKKNDNPLKIEIEELDEVLDQLAKIPKARLQLSTVLSSIHQKMNEGLPVESIIDSIFSSLTHIIPFDRLSIILLVNDDKDLLLKWLKSNSEKVKEKQFSPRLVEVQSIREIIANDNPMIINNFEKYYALHPNEESIKAVVEEGVKSGLACPLRVEGKPIGAITFSSYSPYCYNASHVELFSEVSEGLATIIEHDLLKKTVNESNIKENVFKRTLHDLNNPLSIINATLALMEKKPFFQELGEDAKKSFQMLKRNCDSMIKLTRTLVYEKNESDLITKRNLHEFILEASRDYEILAKNKNITVITDIGPDVPNEAKLNYFALKNVIDNLMSNAIKFSMPEKKIIFRADFNPKKNKLFITVTDEGPGIPEKEQCELFKAFGKTSVQSTAGEPSIGLGLSNVKRLVEEQKGQVFVNSTEGKGSTFGFWISLPT